jgi:diazepam-binding inhibitor (GABA receptor modulating acyl-CoA-binding protein)
MEIRLCPRYMMCREPVDAGPMTILPECASMMTEPHTLGEPGMSTTSKQFEQAAAAAKALPEKPDNNTLLKLYALYKQGSSGDVSGPKPGFMDFVGSAKYEAWSKLQGLSTEQAQAQYIELVRKLGGKV